MKTHRKKEVFVEGAVSPLMIANSIEKHSSQTAIGAHSIFLGQVRADVIDGKKVSAIEYSCYREMADKVFHEIRENIFSGFDLSCMHIYHSLGLVKAGQISLFIFTSSPRRKMAVDACTLLVEEIKHKAPVWGKEIFEDGSFIWKKNTGISEQPL